jgi:4-amino-4-deoxy-L-arabinose transferase-like glycosyltransferase
MEQPLFQNPRHLVLLALLVCSALFLNLGQIPLFDEDEGAYAEVTQEMLRSGDLITPRLEGKPFFHKPPITYWAQAVSVSVLGPSEFAFRLPSVIASMAWCALLFVFVRRYVNQQVAGFAVLFLATAVQTGLITRAAIPDAWLNLFISTTMFAIYAYSQEQRRAYILTAYISMALGFLTKGPVAVLIPLVVSFLFFLWQKEMRTWWRAVYQPLGWLCFLVIALPWYLALYHIHGAQFIEEIFWVHNVGRFRGAMESHSGPIFYYIPVILLGLMPFTTLLLQGVSGLRRHLSSPLGRFLWLWFGFVFVLFSLAGTKLHHYVVYGYVPLLIFMGQAVERLKRPWLLALPAFLFLLFFFFFQDIARWAWPHIDDAFVQLVVKGALDEFGAAHRLVMAVALLAVVIVAAVPRWGIQIRTVLLGCLFMGLFSSYLIPKVARIIQMPIKKAALVAKPLGRDVVMWQMYYPSFSVYLGKPVLKRKPHAGDLVITKANKLEKIKRHEILYQEHGIVLTSIIEDF